MKITGCIVRVVAVDSRARRRHPMSWCILQTDSGLEGISHVSRFGSLTTKPLMRPTCRARHPIGLIVGSSTEDSRCLPHP